VNPEQIIAHFKRLTATLTTTQLISLAAAFLGVVGVVVGSALDQRADLRPVVLGSDAESASAAVTRLKTSKVA
jgi:hypothetical protein